MGGIVLPRQRFDHILNDPPNRLLKKTSPLLKNGYWITEFWELLKQQQRLDSQLVQ
jgi:hypothetical protein